MFRAFNMGIGLILVAAPAEAERIIDTLARHGEPHAVRIGFVVSGSRDVRYV
jgi:phosphoribosylformylglycinamidine cyclo-ligase